MSSLNADRPPSQSPDRDGAALPCLDISSGANPRPYIGSAVDIDPVSASGAPASQVRDGLLTAARTCYGVRASSAAIAAPGMAWLIDALPRMLPGPLKVDATRRVPEEAYAGSAALRLATDLAEAAREPETSASLVNPDERDGAIVTPRTILEIARGRHGGALIVVDESYADAESATSVIPHLRGDDPVLVFRSMDKFYGLPGGQLAFAVGPPPIIERLEAMVGVFSPSADIGALATCALKDLHWQRSTRHWLGNQAQALDAILRNSPLRPADGCRLFRVAVTDDAPAVRAKLAAKGVLTRIFAERPGLIRFGLPGGANELTRLADALAGI